VLHDQGFAQVEDVAGMKEVMVQPWTKAEGTLQIDNKPGVQESIRIDFGENEPRGRNRLPAELDKLSPIERMAKMIELGEIPLDRIPKETLDQIPRETLDRLKEKSEGSAIARRIHFDYQTQTDAEGRFVFDRVRPGKAKIGRYVKIADTIRGFKEILDGKHDSLPEQAFYMIGGIDEAVSNAKKIK